MTVTVLQDIFRWSIERPDWQRDALRRLVIRGELTGDDIVELTDICRSAHGLVDPPDQTPLTEAHLPSTEVSGGAVALESIFHHRGVNALAESQSLKFGPKLTLVYGDNGAGKTGYIRILKSACRTRGQERILGNVVSGSTPNKPAVEIKYRVGARTDVAEWSGEGQDEFISRVSVFDTQSAAVYLTEKTDVAFRPFGLDLFDKLVQACKAVRARLEGQQRALSASALGTIQLEVPETTKVGRLLKGLTSLTKPEAVAALATLSDDERSRLALLERSLLDLQNNDPEKLIRQLRLHATRVRTLAQHLSNVEALLSDASVDEVTAARTEWLRKREEANRLRSATFPDTLLAGTGSDAWKALWRDAKALSEAHAYPAQGFPVVDEGARCLLCQQDISHEAAHRLTQFSAFVASTTERELADLHSAFATKRRALLELNVETEASAETVKELRIEHEDLATAIEQAAVSFGARRKAVIGALELNAPLRDGLPPLATIHVHVVGLASQLDERIAALSGDTGAEKKMAMQTELQELKARVLLAERHDIVLREIDRKKRVAAYELSLNDTKTNAITQKSTAITKSVVTQRLKASFQGELKALEFRHVEVELTEVGGAEGILYHKLVLQRAPGVDLPKVVSEGEQRCLSIAAFFAELSTADDRSGIVFDDPVSSLDYKWRESVARRLVQEANHRQVIVFTHDVVFLLLLKQHALQAQIEPLDQHVRQLLTGAGVVLEELPWVAMPVKKKIGYLKAQWQSADKLYREGHQALYERDAQYLYGLLREAWERALEEVLLGKVVERYRPGVQTQQVLVLADIEENDCRTLDAAMSKCSRWLPGHDEAAAARAPVPLPEVLKEDIEQLEGWCDAINRRRR
jgi:recombinational DNA repair ATPase RecF